MAVRVGVRLGRVGGRYGVEWMEGNFGEGGGEEVGGGQLEGNQRKEKSLKESYF